MMLCGTISALLPASDGDAVPLPSHIEDVASVEDAKGLCSTMVPKPVRHTVKPPSESLYILQEQLEA